MKRQIRKSDLLYSISLMVIGLMGLLIFHPWSRSFGENNPSMGIYQNRTLFEVFADDSLLLTAKIQYIEYYAAALILFLLGGILLLLQTLFKKNSSIVSGISLLVSIFFGVLGFSLFFVKMPLCLIPLATGLFIFTYSGLHFGHHFSFFVGEEMEKRSKKKQ